MDATYASSGAYHSYASDSVGNSSASPVNSPPRGQPQTVEGILGQLGMAEDQAKALASSKHGITLKALFIGPQAPVGIVSAPGSPVSFRRLAASPLPANMGSLAQALAKVASRECATLLAVVLPCATAVNDTQAKIKIASACATAWSAAGLPTPGLVLGDVENSAFQGELRKLLLQQDIAVELKLPLRPLLQLGFTRQDALDRLARVPQPGSTSSSPPLQPLKTLFYEALIHDDREVLDKVLAKFSRWPEKEMRESYNQCCADWVTCTAPPATAPQEGGASLMQDMMLMSPVSQNSLRVQELNAKGPQAMADAIAEGSAEKVKGLLEGGEKFLLNEPLPPMGWTALTLAASLGKKDVVEHLLNCDGIEVNACCPYPPEPTDKVNATVYPTSTQDATPLFMAAMNGHEDVVKLLLEKAEVDINQVNVSDSTPCDIAALNGHMGIFKLLLYRRETDVNRQDPINERTLLYRASSAGLHNVVEELLKHPDISVNLPEFSGASPLLAASRYCHLPVMRLLLADPRVDASVAGKYGQTPLHHVAAHHHQPEAIDLFLNLPLEKKKMLANKVDDWGRTPFSVAIQCGCDEEKFVEPLRKLTALTEVPSVGQVSTKHSQALMVVGSGIALPKASLQTVAAEGKVTLSYLGDGAKDISWKALTQLPDQDGAVGTVYCHGEWNEVSQTHMLVFGEQEGVPTCEALWIMYEKGFRKITVHACRSAHAAAGLARLINRDPRFPKPVDPALEITFVGGTFKILRDSALYDMHNSLKDLGDLHTKRGAGGLMERLTVSSTNTVRWDAEKGVAVVVHRGPPKEGDRGEITEDQRKTTEGHLFLKRVHHSNLDSPASGPTTTTTMTTAAKPGATTTATTTTTNTTTTTTNSTASASVAPIFEETRRLEVLRSMAAQKDFDVNFQGYGGNSALVVAAATGRTQAVVWLLQQTGIEINKGREGGITPLYAAAETGHVDAVRELLKMEDIEINTARTGDVTPLYIAAKKGHTGVVRELRQHAGIDMNRPHKNGGTPLFAAAELGHTDVVRELLKSESIDVNKPHPNGVTPLHAAAEKGHKGVVGEFLKNAGIEVNKTDPSGATALFVAAKNGRTGAVGEFLKNENVEINKANTNGATPLFVAAKEGHADVVTQLLKKKGIDVSKANSMGATPLYVAAQNGHAGVVRLLLKKRGTDVDKGMATGVTPLYVAAELGHADVVRLLLKKKEIDVDKESSAGASPLYVAAQNGCKRIVELLLENGADLSCTVGKAVDIARAKGFTEIVDLLEKAKQDKDKCLTM